MFQRQGEVPWGRPKVTQDVSPGYTYIAAAVGKGQLRSCLIVTFVAWFTLYLQLRSVGRRYLLTCKANFTLT